ncbi:CBS domain-containing protein [Microvirga puerhi]|uniref:CBS domain-containing protein n=1 Tax=Microvirga puerhi TaxID=2876078 RepID=UPI003F72F25E
MKISDVMTRNVRVIAPDRTIRDAARLMDEMNVGSLPVCDGRRLKGIITDRDITVRATAAGLAPENALVRDVMSDNVWWCFDDDDVDHIVELMSDHQIRRLPVIDHAKHLVGIVALGDLATDVEDQASRALHRISTPSEPDRSIAGGQERPRRERLTDDERRELTRRARSDDENEARRRRRPVSGWREPQPGHFHFRRQDDERAAFGIGGPPFGTRERNPKMHGGFGGEGYRNYGEEYGAYDAGRGGGGYRPRRFGTATATGWWEHPGDDSRDDERLMQDRERTWSLVTERRDHSNYGSGPGNTRFENDATASRGEVRRGEHRGKGPRNYQRSDDRIREDIHERLTDDARLDASEIEVIVSNREVTLNGTVRDRNEKRRAEDLAESVSGAAHVQNNLRIGQHQPGHATGTEVGDSGVATGNPGSGTSGIAAGSPSGGRTTGRQRQTG